MKQIKYASVDGLFLLGFRDYKLAINTLQEVFE